MIGEPWFDICLDRRYSLACAALYAMPLFPAKRCRYGHHPDDITSAFLWIQLVESFGWECLQRVFQVHAAAGRSISLWPWPWLLGDLLCV